MTASPVPVAPLRARLWPSVLALSCCLAVYVVLLPFLTRGAGTWPRIVIAIAADVAAVAVLLLLFRLRARASALHATEERLRGEVARLGDEAEQQAGQLRRQADRISIQGASLSAQKEELSAKSAQVSECLDAQAQQDAAYTRLRLAHDELARKLDAARSAIEHETASGAARVADQQESMRLAVVTLSRRLQASSHRIQEEATLLAERRPGDIGVLEASMRVDHAAAQQARNAQSMAVLCGEWPGQQWPDPLPLVDVVRAAAGRIIAYLRVEVTGDPDIAAAAPVVEPMIHLVAELLANATQSSPPATQVPVAVRAVQRGAVIEIHDCGVGLDEYRLSRARDIAAGAIPIGLAELGEIPQTGLAVVGQYVRKHGLRMDISESVYGGIHAVVGIPAELVDIVEPAERASEPLPEPAPPEPSPAESALAPPQAEAGRAAEALPAQPDRREPVLPRRRSPRHDEASPQPTPEAAGEWMGAFLNNSGTGEDPAGQGEQ